MFFTYYTLKKALKNLTIEDFEFKIYTVIRKIDMNEIKVVEREMTISGEIKYLVDIPYVDGCSRICKEFKCINYNFEPFITGNKQFTEDDKARLFNDILKYYCI